MEMQTCRCGSRQSGIKKYSKNTSTIAFYIQKSTNDKGSRPVWGLKGTLLVQKTTDELDRGLKYADSRTTGNKKIFSLTFPTPALHKRQENLSHELRRTTQKHVCLPRSSPSNLPKQPSQ